MRRTPNISGNLMSHRVSASLRHSETVIRRGPNIYRDWSDAPCPLLLLEGPAPRRTPPANSRRGTCSLGSSRLPAFRFRGGPAARDRARLLRCLRYLDPRLVLAPDRVTWRRFQHLLRTRQADRRSRTTTGDWLIGPLLTEWLFVPALNRLVQVVRPVTRRGGGEETGDAVTQ